MFFINTVCSRYLFRWIPCLPSSPQKDHMVLKIKTLANVKYATNFWLPTFIHFSSNLSHSPGRPGRSYHAPSPSPHSLKICGHYSGSPKSPRHIASALMEKRCGIVWPTVKLNKLCKLIHSVLDQTPQCATNVPF